MQKPAAAAVDLLIDTEPSFHFNGTRDWSALPGTLRLIGDLVHPGDITLETGAGASTVVFAAAGARHTAISYSADEHRRIREWCRANGIDDRALTFIEGQTDEVLAGGGVGGCIDVAFMDGRHSFPAPVVDFHHLERRLRVGGVLVMDDVPIPSVAVVFRFLATSADWELVGLADERAAAFRKLAVVDTINDNWREQPLNRSYPDYSFLPVGRRVRLGGQRLLARMRPG